MIKNCRYACFKSTLHFIKHSDEISCMRKAPSEKHTNLKIYTKSGNYLISITFSALLHFGMNLFMKWIFRKKHT